MMTNIFLWSWKALSHLLSPRFQKESEKEKVCFTMKVEFDDRHHRWDLIKSRWREKKKVEKSLDTHTW